MATVEDELRRMGIQEENVPTVAKAILNASAASTLSVDGILSGIKMLMDLEKPKAQLMRIDYDG